MFKNREQVGELLAKKLKTFSNKKDVLVLGVTRGGVVVAKIIADRLNLPLDIIVVKKIGYPLNPELAIGAVGPKKTVYWNENLIKELKISKNEMLELQNEKQKEQEEQGKILRNGKPAKDIKGKTVIIVDDGIATGASAICCSNFLDKESAKEKILAAPVISKDTFNNISRYFDRIVSLKVSRDFSAVGEFYEKFPQVENEEVIKILS